MEKALERLHYREKIKSFTKSDEDRHLLLLEIVKDNELLREELQIIRRDHDNEKQARCLWQDRVAELQESVQILKLEAGSNQIVLVILDGDGAILKDDFYAGGRDGGAEAAYQLRAYIREEIRRRYPDQNTSSWQLMVTMVLSLQGLAKKLLACGIITRPDQLVEFGHGWISQPLFTFTDVGYGKERADHKVRETLQAWLPAAHCKHVYFGPCTDNGYLTTLEEIKPDRRLAAKITLIETRPAEPGFDRLNFAKINIVSIFRSTNLPERHSPRSGNIDFEPKAAATPQPKPRLSPAVTTIAAPAVQAHIEPEKSDQPAVTWVTVGKNLTKGTNGVNMGNKKTQDKAFILLNRKDERIDSDLEKAEPAAEYRFGQRTKDKRMCNDFHLRGTCAIGDKKCPHLHGERLPAAELVVLRQKARGLPCSSGALCRDFACTFGHHCRFKENCGYDSCWFKNNHKMDFRPVKKHYEGCLEPTLL